MLVVALPAVAVGFLLGRAVKPRRPGAPAGSGSPLDSVPLGAWEDFVGRMCVQDKGTVSTKGRIGTFAMDPRRLQDVGAMKNVRKAKVGDVMGVWTGEWRGKLTGERFLGDVGLQYATFVRSMKSLAPSVAGFVGESVEGEKCSLSGLLGVGHAAGEGGVASWVDGSRRFPGTTEAFKRVNGLF